jgi:hypothetical protein
MTTRLSIVFALGLVMGLVLAVFPAHAENRPAELGLFTQLNGEVSRGVNTAAGGNADGGGLSLYSVDAGPGCNNVATGGVYEIHCNAAGHFCPWGSDGGAGLAFCGTTIGNLAYGKPVAASTPSSPAPFWYVAPAGDVGAVKNICIVPASGTLSMTCAVFRMR